MSISHINIHTVNVKLYLIWVAGGVIIFSTDLCKASKFVPNNVSNYNLKSKIPQNNCHIIKMNIEVQS